METKKRFKGRTIGSEPKFLIVGSNCNLHDLVQTARTKFGDPQLSTVCVIVPSGSPVLVEDIEEITESDDLVFLRRKDEIVWNQPMATTTPAPSSPAPTKPQEAIDDDDDSALLSAVKDICKHGKPKFLLVGPSGCGKSTFVNRLFGEALAKVGAGRPITQNYTKYDNDRSFVILYDWKGYETHNTTSWGNSTKKILKQEGCHAVFYFVNAAARWQKFDNDLCNLMDDTPKFFFISKCDTVTEQERKAIEAAIREDREPKPDFKGVYIIGKWEPQPPDACPECGEKVTAVPCDKQWSCMKTPTHKGIFSRRKDDLEAFTYRCELVLPEPLKEPFRAAQKVNIKQKIPLMVATIATATGTAAAIGAIPLPFSDITLLVPLQTTMLTGLAAIIGVPMQKYPKVLAGQAAMQGLVGLGGLGLSNLLKLMLPVVGSIATAVIDATVASTITAALGILYCIVLVELRSYIDILEEALPANLVHAKFDERITASKVKELVQRIVAAMKKNQDLSKIATDILTQALNK